MFSTPKGQIVAIQAAILPKPYREAFANIFDSAPEVEWDEIEKVRTEDFGPLRLMASYLKLTLAFFCLGISPRVRRQGARRLFRGLQQVPDSVGFYSTGAQG
jgi:hypothetical protein